MAFGTELLFIIALGFLVLGPKRLHETLRQVAGIKAQLEGTGSALEFQLESELASRDDNSLRTFPPQSENLCRPDSVQENDLSSRAE